MLIGLLIIFISFCEKNRKKEVTLQLFHRIECRFKTTGEKRCILHQSILNKQKKNPPAGEKKKLSASFTDLFCGYKIHRYLISDGTVESGRD